MEISKISPVAASKPLAGNAAAPEQRTQSSATLEPPADRADIRPLDIAGALQILVAEVRAGLELALQSVIAPRPVSANGLAIAQDPAQAAHELVQMFLQEIPDDAANARAWIATLVRVEAAIQSSMERALSLVTQWRDVPAAAVDAVQETRTLFLSALVDDPPNPLWLRPEWAGLAPLWFRFRRRRRNARRRLTDPDYAAGNLDDENEGFRR